MENRNKTILIVDDDQAIVRLFSTVLRLRGFNILEASNGEEALDQMSQRRVDMVITDWKMPNMNGMTLLDSLRTDALTRKLPVLLISAAVDEKVMERACELGACRWLTKPFNFRELTSIINDVLQ